MKPTKDYNLWLEQTALTSCLGLAETAVKNKDMNNLDWERILELIEDTGASERRALRSYMKRLVEHLLLKIKYWDNERECNYKHWNKEIVNFRSEVRDILKESPSLKRYLQDNYSEWHNSSVEAMSQEFDLHPDAKIDLKGLLVL
ncbi:hypothetical protein STA3757_14920 [Stanieria sp. NIES-3757]|nr:hypothetical protein STA3757_14920 [Stanieria sp. NIES-3757]